MFCLNRNRVPSEADLRIAKTSQLPRDQPHDRPLSFFPQVVIHWSSFPYQQLLYQ